MELVGTLATLRPWRTSDSPSLAKYANNPNVARQLRDRFPHPYTTADARQFIQSIAHARPATSFAIAIGGGAAGGPRAAPRRGGSALLGRGRRRLPRPPPRPGGTRRDARSH